MTGMATSDGEDARRTDRSSAGEVVVVMNAALVGVPASYAVSGSVPVTAIGAVLAIVLVIVSVRRRRR